MRNPCSMPEMMYCENWRSGWCCKHVRQASRLRGVTICVRHRGRVGGEGLIAAYRCNRSAEYR